MRMPLKILIVDDALDIREIFESLLNSEGHKVYAASTGEEALEVAQKHPFDLAFVDMVMPGISGIETMAKLKELQADITIVIMSAHPKEDDIEKAWRLGAYGCIMKPFDMMKILHIVDTIQTVREQNQVRPSGVQVLVIDDSRLIREFYSIVLSKYGHTVETVSNGEEGIKKVKEKKYDAIFLDVMMPGLNGAETLRQIRAIQAQVPVILITGFGVGKHELVSECYSLGVWAVLEKAVDSVEIEQTLEKILLKTKFT